MLDGTVVNRAFTELVSLRRLAVMLNEDPDDAVDVARAMTPMFSVPEAARAVSHWLADGLSIEQIVAALATDDPIASKEDANEAVNALAEAIK